MRFGARNVFFYRETLENVSLATQLLPVNAYQLAALVITSYSLSETSTATIIVLPNVFCVILLLGWPPPWMQVFRPLQKRISREPWAWERRKVDTFARQLCAAGKQNARCCVRKTSNWGVDKL